MMHFEQENRALALMSVQISTKFSVASQTVRSWIHRQRVSSVVIDGELLVDEQGVRSYLSSRSAKGLYVGGRFCGPGSCIYDATKAPVNSRSNRDAEQDSFPVQERGMWSPSVLAAAKHKPKTDLSSDTHTLVLDGETVTRLKSAART